MSRMSNKEFNRLRHAYPLSEELRSRILERAEYNCEECGIEEFPLQLHHLHYGNPFGSIFGKETLHDLEALCESCHHNRHFAPDGRQFRDPLELAQYWADGQPTENTIKFLDACKDFADKNPMFGEQFTKMALAAIEAGRTIYSASYITEGIRWDTNIMAPQDRMIAYFGRKFMMEYDKLGFFETTFSMADFWEPWFIYKLKKEWVW